MKHQKELNALIEEFKKNVNRKFREIPEYHHIEVELRSIFIIADSPRRGEGYTIEAVIE